ncbi:MAG: SDR family NAD(P)-dependent oxidoreductase [Gammaproteobacteria bacterium]|nr:SDR family NAD(P)-dependent oxidoreductase [Gammaproteobacteria bacterium]
MKKLNGCVAVITGAGSGIGRQLAYQLADAGAHLAISDINKSGLDKTRLNSESRGNRVYATTLDVSDEEGVFTYAADVEQEFGKVNLVINNAGVALASGPLSATPIDEFKWLMNINFYGVLYGTKAFLPVLEKADWGHIVNISSLFGLVSVPDQAAYNASKFAVRGMTDALRMELEEIDSTVSCTTVHPGGIKTNIARSARISRNQPADFEQEHAKSVADFDKIARTTAEQAAVQIVKAVLSNKRRLLIGADARFVDKIQRLWPTAYPRIFNFLVERMTR